VDVSDEWTCLNVAVDPLEGALKWTSNMKAESIAPVLESWEDSLEAIVWDGAKGHQGEEDRG
jgi:hypothetical protein